MIFILYGDGAPSKAPDLSIDATNLKEIALALLMNELLQVEHLVIDSHLATLRSQESGKDKLAKSQDN
jgi:hypothetical protein